MPTPDRYSTLQIVLHWSIAVLVVAQFIVNDDIRIALQERLRPGVRPVPEVGALFHIVSGLVILGLTLLRLAIRLVRGTPAPEENIPPIVQKVAALTHALFYAALILMPVTGALAWFAGMEPAAVAHEVGRLVLLPAILAHVLGALAEHFVLRNDTLRRMLQMSDR